MYELINGQCKMIVYDKVTADLYINNGWKLIKQPIKVKPKKVEKEIENNDNSKLIEE